MGAGIMIIIGHSKNDNMKSDEETQAQTESSWRWSNWRWRFGDDKGVCVCGDYRYCRGWGFGMKKGDGDGDGLIVISDGSWLMEMVFLRPQKDKGWSCCTQPERLRTVAECATQCTLE